MKKLVMLVCLLAAATSPAFAQDELPAFLFDAKLMMMLGYIQAVGDVGSLDKEFVEQKLQICSTPETQLNIGEAFALLRNETPQSLERDQRLLQILRQAYPCN